MTYGHDVTEVAPGRVVTASIPLMRFLDARRDAVRPRQRATADSHATGTNGYIGTAAWPRAGHDSFLLTTEETSFTPRCEPQTSSFATWDASRWRKTRTFTLIDTYRLANGTVVDGSPPVNAVGCSTHVFDAHPDFHDGGLVAVAYYEHGTRLLRVTGDGAIREVGWFLPWAGSTSAAYWVTDEIVYAIDFTRGIDILRVSAR